MQEFSLEKMSEDIHYGKTKEYFREVLSSYQNGNYRSSVVMLWSVAICDIIYKLQHLIDLYNDNAAKTILQEVSRIQEQDIKSSAWEIKLLDEVYNKTSLLDTSDYENLKYLQKQRHLSAHPVLNSERELHSPNKETVRSLLRNTLESLLVKPPIYTQRIFSELIKDISESKNVINSREKVKRYIESRYLNRTTPSVELNIFRSLWKFVFKLDDDESENNRIVNLRTLEVLSSRNISLIPNEIKGDKDYYSNVSPAESPLSFLVYYLAKNHHLYPLLSDDARLKIDHCISTDEVGKTMGWFIKADLNAHCQDIKKWIASVNPPKFTHDQLDALLCISDSEEWQKMFCDIVATYYGSSCNYKQADSRFEVAIPKYIHLFDRKSLINLTKRIENNSLCYGRGQARNDYNVIKQRIEKLFGDGFDYSDVPCFQRKIMEVI
jgi:hypothetical protein